MMKLLITARDPATAVSFERLIPELFRSNRFQLKVLCQEPAYGLLKALIPREQLERVAEKDCKALLQEGSLQTIFKRFQPDAVLTGISGPDTGLDEAVLHYAEQCQIHSYALQNSWGGMNRLSGALPKTAFVIDQEAARLTHQRYPQIESVPIGSLKHAGYRYYDPVSSRQKNRPGLVGLDSDTILVGFFGQPIPGVLGYFETVEGLIRQLSKWQRPFKLLYRPHPKESRQQRDRTLDLFRKAFGNQVEMNPCQDIKDSLVVCDLVLSAFSSSCFDNLYLNEVAAEPFNVSVYLWFEPALIQWWQSYSQLEQLPLVTEELLLSVDTEDELLFVLEKGLRGDTRHYLWNRAKRSLPCPQASADLLIHKLLSDFDAMKHGMDDTPEFKKRGKV
jgi:hypothetical protein